MKQIIRPWVLACGMMLIHTQIILAQQPNQVDLAQEHVNLEGWMFMGAGIAVFIAVVLLFFINKLFTRTAIENKPNKKPKQVKKEDRKTIKAENKSGTEQSSMAEAARQRAEEEQRRAAEAARQRAEEEQRRAAEAARQRAEEEQRRAAEMARQRAEEEQRRAAEAARQRAEEEQRRAAEMARQRAEEEQRRAAEMARQRAEEEQRRAAEAARQRAEEEQRRAAEVARQRAEEEQRKAVEAARQKQSAGAFELELVEVTDAPSSAHSIHIDLSNERILGRNVQKCDVVIAGDPAVSGVHCQFYTFEGKVYVMDLDSTNGTYVNNKRIRHAVVLMPGDLIFIGSKEYRVKK